MKKLIFIGTLLYTSLIFSQDYSDKYAYYINKEDLKEHLEIIASDSFAGRETGYAGQKITTDYLISEFKKDGLAAPKGFEDYKFPFDVLETQASGSITFDKKTYKFKEDFIYLFADQPTEFLNYSTFFVGSLDKFKSTKKLNYQQYAENRIVVVYVKTGTSFEDIRSTYKEFNELKAASVFFVLEDYDKFYGFLEHFVLESKMILNSDEVERTCPMILTNSSTLNFGIKHSEKLEKKKWKKAKYLKKKYDGLVSFTLSEEAKVLGTENVVAFIEGEDESLKNEVLVLTAHYDHIGTHGGEVYNGADDDGSGTVALLEIAEAFQIAKKQGNGPKRSILIMPVAGEEKGLLGSEYYSKHPIFPLKNTIADLNIDMIGRTDDYHTDPNYVYIIGSNMISDDLHEANKKANEEHVNILLDYKYNTLDDPNRYYYRSDHYNFAVNGIPSIFYFSGVHEDYHQPTDTVDKIDFDKLEKVTKLVFHTAWILANAEKRPQPNK